MRILTVAPHYLPAIEFGGPPKVAHALSVELVRLGHEVHVCTTNLKNANEDLQISTDDYVITDGVQVLYSPTSLSRYWGFSPVLYKRLKHEICLADLVLVHFHYQFASWAGSFLARAKNRPYVLFAHGSFNKWGIANKSARKKQQYLRLLERKNIEQAKFIAFNSSEEQQLSLFAERGVVIPNGIDPREFDTVPVRNYWRSGRKDLERKICFLYLGRLNPSQKGLDVLIPAFAQLLKLRSDVHLILAGPDERGGEAELRQLANSLNIQRDVTFTGLVSGQEKLALLRDSDAFVLVSPSEGTSIALLEAMYMQLPVIVTSRIGLANQVRDHRCGFVPEREISQIAKAMFEVAERADYRNVMGRNAHNLVARDYTWDAIAKTLIIAVEEVDPR